MNLPILSTVGKGEHRLICVVTFGGVDGFEGCYWTLYDLDGKQLSSGYSKGRNGCGSALDAMANARAAARRRLKS